MNRIVIRSAVLLLGIFLIRPATFAQGTAFTYQGRMIDNGTAATGAYDLKFSLFNAYTNGTAISFPQTNFATGITNGLFTSTLDFGSVFTGTNYWLALGVRTNGSTNAFTLLWPRQLLTPVPYAIFANIASNLIGTLSATQLVGTLPSAQVSGNYTGGVNFTNATNSFSGTFFGTGSSLNSLNASNLTFGTVADARLTTNVALLDHNQIFTGTNIFTNRYNSYVGSFFGNGLVGWLVITGTTQQANINSGYVLISSNLTTLTLPTNAIVGDIVRVSGAGTGGWRIAQYAGQNIAGSFFTPSNSTWILANAPNAGWQAIAAAADGLKMVASAAGGSGLYTSADAGKTWGNVSTIYSPTSLASSADGNRLVGATRGGGVITSTDAGLSWSLLTPGNIQWSGVTISADGSKFAATISNSPSGAGTVYIWSNYGATSNFPAIPLAAPLSAISGSADCTRLAATAYGGGIYLSANSGASWTASTAPTANWTCITSSADGYRLAAAINGGTIYTSSDAGATWNSANAPNAAWSAIASSSDGGRIAASINTNVNGGVYISANYGKSWIRQSVPEQFWRGVACSADGAKVAAVYQNTTVSGKIYSWQATAQNTASTVGTNGSVTGSFGSAVELQYIGNGRFMPVSSSGIFWAN
jgi:hypothetical protein